MKTLLTQLLGAALLVVASLSALAVDDDSQAELNQLLAPVALYPDTVLSHILIASTYPLEVVQAHRWAQSHSNLEGAVAVEAADKEPWDPSVKALVAFPELLERMSDDLDWTQRLGDAFLRDEEAVLATVQDLRQRAYESGNLRTTEHQEVVVERQTIIVEPRVPDVIYIPYYDTRVVYGPWRWHHYPPVVWHRPSRGYWHAGIFWSFGTHIDSTHFYFSGVHWLKRHTVVIDLHHDHHRPRFHSSRSVVRYKDTRRWHHDPSHRRGVKYRHQSVRHKYALPVRADTDNRGQRRHHRADTVERRLQSPTNRRDDLPHLNRRDDHKRPLNAGRSNLDRNNVNRNDVDRNKATRLEQRLGNDRRARNDDSARRRHDNRTERQYRTERHQEPSNRAQRNRQDRPEHHNARQNRPQRTEHHNARNQRQHRAPERSQQNLQRSMRDRVDAARNKRSITDRARQSRQGNGRSERR